MVGLTIRKDLCLTLQAHCDSLIEELRTCKESQSLSLSFLAVVKYPLLRECSFCGDFKDGFQHKSNLKQLWEGR